MPTGEETDPRGDTNRIGCIKIREPDAFLRHSIEMGRPDEFLAVAAETCVAQIIRHDEDDVWLGTRVR